MRLKKLSTPTVAACSAALLLGLAGVLPARAAGFGKLILQKDSLYHRIFVYQDGPVMTLQFGRMRTDVVQSQVDVGNLRRNMHEYTQLSFCGLLYKADPKRMLVVGLGGGVIPREMHHYFPDMQIDVAEIDPDIPPIAEKYFAFQTDDRLKVSVDDGRMFIRKALRQKPVQKYDYIVLDAFTSDYIPFHLMTKEFLDEVKGVLADDGVVVANIFYNSELADAELKTYLAAFDRCQVYMGAFSGNAMLVSPGSSVPVLTADGAMARARTLKMPPDCTIDMQQVASRLRPEVVPAAGAIVLTDDRAPVNYLRTQKPEDIASGPADTLELLNGQSFQGKLVDQGDEQVSFRVISAGGTNALMVWPAQAVKAITVNGIRRVVTETPPGTVQVH
jgi:spermidine synthase